MVNAKKTRSHAAMELVFHPTISAMEVSTVPILRTRLGAVRIDGCIILLIFRFFTVLILRLLYIIYINWRDPGNFSFIIDIEKDENSAPFCDPKKCRSPDCWCSEDGTKVPGNLNVSEVPQIISITFNDAVNAENIDLFSSLL